MKKRYNYGGYAAGVAADILQSAQYSPSGDINEFAMVGAPALKGAASGFAVGGPVGGAIGLVAGAASGLVSTNKAREELDRLQRSKEVRQQSYDRNVSTMLKAGGQETPTTYYKCGGKRRMAMGGVMPIGSTGMEAVGPKHEQGGVQIPGAEVEGGEVAMKDGNVEVWYSDRLSDEKGTFAEQAQSLLSRKAEYEKLLNSRDKQAVNSAMQKIDEIDMQLAQIAAKQKEQQDAMGVPSDGQVGAYGTTIERAVPYLDNLVNTGVIANTPNVPTPTYNRAVPLETTYNVSDQLNELRRSRSALNTAIDRSTSSASVARGNKVAGSLENVSQTNKILGEKQRIEVQLRNQNAMNQQTTEQSNVALDNQRSLLDYQRRDAIGQRISQNAANATEDAMAGIQEDRLRNRDMIQLELLKKRYNDLGLWDRNMAGAFENFTLGTISYEEFLSTVNRKDLTTAPIQRRNVASVKSIGKPRPIR